MSEITIQEHVRCIFCHEIITNQNVMGCSSPNNPLPPMTAGGIPHAIESKSFPASVHTAEDSDHLAALNDAKESQMHLAMELERKDEGIRKLRDALEVLSNTLKERADNAYCEYIRQMHTTACLGWEEKIKQGRFGDTELSAHTWGGTLLGEHRAFAESAKQARAALQETEG